MIEMNLTNLRLKINLSTDLELDEYKLWYFLDLTQIKTIDELRRDILRKYFLNNIEKKSLFDKNVVVVKLSVDKYELPLFESTHLLRDSDLVELRLHLLSKNNLKRKISNDSIEKQPLTKKANLNLNYKACLIGSSMIKHIQTKDLFKDKKCYFKSISGGKIKDILSHLKLNELVLKDVAYFIVTCGSNDCDSLNDLKTVINDYIELAQYLYSTNQSSYFIFNKLIPRTKCRFVSLLEFEKRRVCFNDFLQITLPLIVPCKIVEHKAFETKTELCNLLIDGVHISPVRGLPLYVEEIKKILNNL